VSGWAFIALGRPAPQGSKRHVGNGVMIESSKAVKPWREAVKAAAPSGPTLDGPIAVYMVFTMPRPKSALKRETIPYKTPDLSKLCRATEDAITEAGMWADDARVSDYVRLAKVWTGYDEMALMTPGVLIAAVERTEWDLDVFLRAREVLDLHRAEWQRTG